MIRLTIPMPINAHGHLRQGAFMRALAILASLYFRVYLAMPNLKPSILTGAEAMAYKTEIDDATGGVMEIIPTIKITGSTTPQMIHDATKLGIKFGKVYPLGRTTHADDGVDNYHKLFPVFEEMQRCGMTALFHPTHPEKMFEGREAEFQFLAVFHMIRQNFPDLRMTWEHLSDARCIQPLKEMQQKYGNIYVTITAHHLVGNEDQHHGDVTATCQPPIRSETDRRGLVELVCEGNSWVMAGLDDAPHPIETKHVSGPCTCGAYTTPFGILLYATALHRHGLFADGMRGKQVFAGFVSRNAEAYFGLEPGNREIYIVEEPWTIPEVYDFDGTKVIPFMAGKTLPFSYVTQG